MINGNIQDQGVVSVVLIANGNISIKIFKCEMKSIYIWL